MTTPEASPTEQAPPERAPQSRRVVIAIDPPGEYADVLEAAARLATRLEARLEALLVEDSGLLDAAQLPFTRAFDHAGRERDLDHRLLARAWASERHRLGQAVERCAASLNVRASLRVVQGRFLTEALAAARQVDATVLVHSRSLARGLSSSDRDWLRAREPATRTPRRSRPIWVYVDDSEAAQRALELAVNLAGDYRAALIVLHQQSMDAAELGRRIDALANARALTVTCLPVTGRAAELLGVLRRPEGAALVLAPRDAIAASELPGVLEGLAGKLCPLILVA